MNTFTVKIRASFVILHNSTIGHILNLFLTIQIMADLSS